MKRRDFVRTLTAAGTGLLLLTPSPSPKISPICAPRPTPTSAASSSCSNATLTPASSIPRPTSSIATSTNTFPAPSTSPGRQRRRQRRYVWTTGSWLLYEYLEQASPADRKAMEAGHRPRRHRLARAALHLAIGNAYALPHRGQPRVSQSLDRRFGRNHPAQDDRRPRPHPRPHRAPRQARRHLPRNRRQRRHRPSPNFPPSSSGRLPRRASPAHHVSPGLRRDGARARLGPRLVTRSATTTAARTPPKRSRRSTAIWPIIYPKAEITAGNLSDMANALAPIATHCPLLPHEIGDTWIYGVPQRSRSKSRATAPSPACANNGSQTAIRPRRRHRYRLPAPPAAGAGTHLGHRHQDLAGLRQLQARRPRPHARHQELQGRPVQLE